MKETGTMRLFRWDVSLPNAVSVGPCIKSTLACERIDDIIYPLILGSWFAIASPSIGLAFYIMTQQADSRGVYGFP
ncbi:MAG: hypothetical protein ABSB41_12855 [Anaerolineales bacterium]|jgi:hypothetical protein